MWQTKDKGNDCNDVTDASLNYVVKENSIPMWAAIMLGEFPYLLSGLIGLFYIRKHKKQKHQKIVLRGLFYFFCVFFFLKCFILLIPIFVKLSMCVCEIHIWGEIFVRWTNSCLAKLRKGEKKKKTKQTNKNTNQKRKKYAPKAHYFLFLRQMKKKMEQKKQNKNGKTEMLIQIERLFRQNTFAWIVTSLVTEVIKYRVGRPRPNYYNLLPGFFWFYFLFFVCVLCCEERFVCTERKNRHTKTRILAHTHMHRWPNGSPFIISKWAHKFYICSVHINDITFFWKFKFL